jgi:hypothetical protein
LNKYGGPRDGVRALALLALAGLVAQARPAVGQDVAVGARLGLNLADVSSPDFGLGGVDTRVAFVGGGFLNLSGEGPFSFQTELLFSQKGFSALAQGGNLDAALDYLEIPLLLKYRIGPRARRLRPTVLAGWFVAFELRCRLSGALEGVDTSPECEAQRPGGFLGNRGKLDTGLVVGVGVDYGLSGNLFLAADARYDVGVITIQWEEEDDDVSSRVWSFSAGIGVLLR